MVNDAIKPNGKLPDLAAGCSDTRGHAARMSNGLSLEIQSIENLASKRKPETSWSGYGKGQVIVLF